MCPGRPANAHVSSSLKGPLPLEAAGDTATDRLGTRNPQEAAASAGGVQGDLDQRPAAGRQGRGKHAAAEWAQPGMCPGKPPHGLFPPRLLCWWVPSVWHVGPISPCREPELVGPCPGASWTPSQPQSKEFVPGTPSQPEKVTLPLWGDCEEGEPQAPFRGQQESLQASKARAVWGKGLPAPWCLGRITREEGRKSLPSRLSSGLCEISQLGNLQ